LHLEALLSHQKSDTVTAAGFTLQTRLILFFLFLVLKVTIHNVYFMNRLMREIRFVGTVTLSLLFLYIHQYSDSPTQQYLA
jgi:hypothetical protein